jgi:hypothetical protein
MTTRTDAHIIAAALARGLNQLCSLGLLSEGGRGQRPAARLEVVRDALAQTESGALAGYGSTDTRQALDVWRLVQRLFESNQNSFPEMDNQELADFLDKLRKAAYGPQISHALARWLPSRMFISAQYTTQQLEKMRPAGNSGRGLSGRPAGTR